MFVSKLDPRNWLVSGEDTYLVSSIGSDSDGKNNLWLSVARAATDDPDQVEITTEIWSNKVWAVCAEDVLVYLVQDYLSCKCLDLPIELVYTWGGQLRGRTMRVPNLGVH